MHFLESGLKPDVVEDSGTEVVMYYEEITLASAPNLSDEIDTSDTEIVTEERLEISTRQNHITSFYLDEETAYDLWLASQGKSTIFFLPVIFPT